jgi:diguanylate cyclase (GGDEF)-like protein
MAGLNGQSQTHERSSVRSKELHDHMRALAGRDFQLFSISLLMLVVISSGVLAIAYPNLVTPSSKLTIGARLLPQLLWGFITLIVLFNVYVILQKRELSATRRRLVEELIFNERMESVSMIDSSTQVYNRRAMEQMLAHEVARATRLDSPLSLMILQIPNLESINKKLGNEEAEYFLYEAAQLLTTTLRGSDMVFRYKPDTFLAVMPDTTEHQVDFAIKRLNAEVIRRNAEYGKKIELSLLYGVAQHVSGFRITDALRDAERKISNSALPVY